jgi:hypothetical protein
MLGWPKRYRLACAFLWEYSNKGLKLAQRLGHRGVFPTWRATSSSIAATASASSLSLRSASACSPPPTWKKEVSAQPGELSRSVDIITRTSQCESFTMSGAGYDVDGSSKASLKTLRTLHTCIHCVHVEDWCVRRG